MTEKDSLSLSLSLSLSVWWALNWVSSSKGDWTLEGNRRGLWFLGKQFLLNFFLGFSFSLVCSRIFPSFTRDVCFSWICIVISGTCFFYIGGWKSY
jgi:protein-S-isoprenylcysteine O-methyltransferase Ste14